MSMQLQQNPLNDNSWLVTRQPSNASDPDDPFINLVKTLFENNIPTGKIDAVLNLIQDLSDLCIEFSKENDEKPAIDFKSYYDDIIDVRVSYCPKELRKIKVEIKNPSFDIFF